MKSKILGTIIVVCVMLLFGQAQSQTSASSLSLQGPLISSVMDRVAGTSAGTALRKAVEQGQGSQEGASGSSTGELPQSKPIGPSLGDALKNSGYSQSVIGALTSAVANGAKIRVGHISIEEDLKNGQVVKRTTTYNNGYEYSGDNTNGRPLINYKETEFRINLKGKPVSMGFVSGTLITYQTVDGQGNIVNTVRQVSVPLKVVNGFVTDQLTSTATQDPNGKTKLSTTLIGNKHWNPQTGKWEEDIISAEDLTPQDFQNIVNEALKWAGYGSGTIPSLGKSIFDILTDGLPQAPVWDTSSSDNSGAGSGSGTTPPPTTTPPTTTSPEPSQAPSGSGTS